MMGNYRIILKNKRRALKWTQQEAADKIGISRSYYGDIETGRTTPSGNIIFKINEVIPIFLPLDDVGKKTSGKEVKENV